MTPFFPACPSDLRPRVLYEYWALGTLSPPLKKTPRPPHIRFLFVEHAFCYQLPSSLTSPLNPCRVANLSPHRAGSGFAPYRGTPCWAHIEKRRRTLHSPPLPTYSGIKLFCPLRFDLQRSRKYVRNRKHYRRSRRLHGHRQLFHLLHRSG